MTMEELEDYLDNRDSDPAQDAEKYAKSCSGLTEATGLVRRSARRTLAFTECSGR